jgi:hypothetical protein
MLMLNRRLFTGLLAAGVVASITSGIVQAPDTPVASAGVVKANGFFWLSEAAFLLEAAQR